MNENQHMATLLAMVAIATHTVRRVLKNEEGRDIKPNTVSSKMLCNVVGQAFRQELKKSAE